VAVPVAVACDPRGVSTVPWPARPGGTTTSVPPTTSTTEAPVADLATLDEWHYVGEAGEPAFQNGWANGSGAFPALAFRIREAGIVDIMGFVDGGTPNTTIFTLPGEYRPATTTATCVSGQSSGTMHAGLLTIDTAGNVYGDRPGTGQDRIYIQVQIFLSPPTS
jgi:hypothetical protein